MFAIIKTGGKQYRISPGDILKLESLGEKKGSKVNFTDVMMFNNDKTVLIGSPYLVNVKISATILENKKDKKVLIFKKRRRHNSRRLNGHRQLLTVVKIDDIIVDGKVIADNSEKKKKVSNKKAKTENTEKALKIKSKEDNKEG